MNAVTVKNLVKVYKNGTRALKGVDLEVPEGDFFALLGANGAGKTTIIGILTGIITKTSGLTRVFDIDLEHGAPRARRLIGVVPQEMNFNMFEKTLDIIISQAGYFGIDRYTAAREAEVILKKLELWDKRETQSRMLSGGMKRRLMIARALIHKPKLLILDEPTAGVDVELRHEMWDYLRELNKNGTTIILTTHYLEEVEQMCRHAAIIKTGEIVKHDQVRSLLRLLEKETYVVHVEKVLSLERLKPYSPRPIDESTFEVEINKKTKLNDFISELSAVGMVVTDIRPKGNRLEKLFLSILKQ